MVESVVINSEEPTEDPKHLEEMAAKGAALRNGESPAATEDHPKDEPNADRPDWLPEKFKSAEDLAAAYKELEKKQGKASGEEPKGESETPQDDQLNPDLAITPEKEAEDKLQEQGIDMAGLRQEYRENQSLSEETYARLEKSGFSKADVDAYIEGQKAVAAQIQQEGYDYVGGKENYAAMAEWARANLSQAEAEAFNKQINSADTREFAIRGLFGKYTASEGSEPNRVVNGERGNLSGDVYTSRQQMVADMATEKYKKDPAEQARVQQKLARSKLW